MIAGFERAYHPDLLVRNLYAAPQIKYKWKVVNGKHSVTWCSWTPHVFTERTRRPDIAIVYRGGRFV